METLLDFTYQGMQPRTPSVAVCSPELWILFALAEEKDPIVWKPYFCIAAISHKSLGKTSCAVAVYITHVWVGTFRPWSFMVTFKLHAIETLSFTLIIDRICCFDFWSFSRHLELVLFSLKHGIFHASFLIRPVRRRPNLKKGVALSLIIVV